jgi:hypothetical protein
METFFKRFLRSLWPPIMWGPVLERWDWSGAGGILKKNPSGLLTVTNGGDCAIRFAWMTRKGESHNQMKYNLYTLALTLHTSILFELPLVSTFFVAAVPPSNG